MTVAGTEQDDALKKGDLGILKHTLASGLTRRYLVVFLLFILIPAVTLTLFINQSYLNYLRETASDSFRETVKQIKENLDTEIRNLAIRGAALLEDDNFQKAVRHYTSAIDNEERLLASRDLNSSLQSFVNYSNKIGSVILIPADTRPHYIYRNYPATSDTLKLDGNTISQMLAGKESFYLLDDLSGVVIHGNSFPLITLATDGGNVLKSPGIRAFLFSFQLNILDQLSLMNQHNPGLGMVYIFSGGDKLLLASRNAVSADLLGLKRFNPDSKVETFPLARGLDDKRYIITGVKLNRSGWKLFYVKDYKTFIKPVVLRQQAALFAACILTLFFAVYTFFFFHDILTPLKVLRNRMQLVAQGDYTVKADLHAPEDILLLLKQFNTMVDEINRLTAQNRRQEEHKRHAELTALQARINPHFIGNTLNLIRMMAVNSDNTAISNMTGNLQKIVNEGFRNSNSFTVLDDEIKLLEAFFYIMKVRFGEMFTVEFHVDQSVREAVILRMLLQPVAENAVLHGIAPAGRTGKITISAWREADDLRIQIEDNGVGISYGSKAPADSRHEHVDGSGIGLSNVKKRILLHYGESYGISITSEPDKYTAVRFRLPFSTSSLIEEHRD